MANLKGRWGRLPKIRPQISIMEGNMKEYLEFLDEFINNVLKPSKEDIILSIILTLITILIIAIIKIKSK